MFRKFGLAEVQREPVPMNYWKPLTTSLEFTVDAIERPGFPIPYTSWTASTGVESPALYVDEGKPAAFKGGDVLGCLAVAEVRFAERMGAAFKQGLHFVTCHQDAPFASAVEDAAGSVG